jgi:hypothetical protein
VNENAESSHGTTSQPAGSSSDNSDSPNSTPTYSSYSYVDGGEVMDDLRGRPVVPSGYALTNTSPRPSDPYDDLEKTIGGDIRYDDYSNDYIHVSVRACLHHVYPMISLFVVMTSFGISSPSRWPPPSGDVTVGLGLTSTGVAGFEGGR